MVTEDDITYSYDDNGNLKEKTSAEENVKYFYDAENHLTRVETTRFGATIVVEYEYDAEGNRVKKTIDGLITTTYLVDENRGMDCGKKLKEFRSLSRKENMTRQPIEALVLFLPCMQR